jgi:hypothetical protein
MIRQAKDLSPDQRLALPVPMRDPNGIAVLQASISDGQGGLMAMAGTLPATQQSKTVWLARAASA